MTITPRSYDWATRLLTCWCAELATNEANDPTLPAPARCCLRAGIDIPMDVTEDGFVLLDACCAGEAWVKVVNIFPASQAFPEPDSVATNSPCQLQMLAVQMELGIMRCLPAEPDCAQSAQAVRQMTADAEAAFRAMCCWVTSMKSVNRGVKWFAQGWEMAGPEGQCLSGTMQVFASIPGPCCN